MFRFKGVDNCRGEWSTDKGANEQYHPNITALIILEIEHINSSFISALENNFIYG